MSKVGCISSFKFSLLNVHENTKILPIPVNYLMYPEPSIAIGQIDLLN